MCVPMSYRHRSTLRLQCSCQMQVSLGSRSPAAAVAGDLTLTINSLPAGIASPTAAGDCGAAASGLGGLLRVAAAELPGLRCHSVSIDPQTAGKTNAVSDSKGFADGHRAVRTAGAWTALRLLPAPTSAAAGADTAGGTADLTSASMQGAGNAPLIAQYDRISQSRSV